MTDLTAPTQTVSERALIGRINRVLAKDGERLCKCRENSRWYYDLGDFYVVDDRNNLTGSHIADLEGYGRELKVLRHGETLAA